MSKKGIALIAVIILIAFVAISVLGVARFVSNAMILSVKKSLLEQALYAAQAGVSLAIGDYKEGGFWQSLNEPYFVTSLRVGRSANFLLIDASMPLLAGSEIKNIPLTNLNGSQKIIVNSMKVEWSSNFTGRLMKVYLGGQQLWQNAAGVGSGAPLSPFSSFSLNAMQSYDGSNDNRWVFSQSVPEDAIILITFFFTDGSRKAYLMNDHKGGNKEFSITSTGNIGSGRDIVRRTIDATYDVNKDRITSWREIGEHIK